MSARLLVVSCPDWPITAARAEAAGASGAGALALVRGSIVVHCSSQARAHGVVPGQRLRDAQVIIPELEVIADDPERDRRLWSVVLDHLSQSVARVIPLEPGLLAISARGLARYYGSEHTAAQHLISAIAECGIATVVRVGIADTLFAAVHAAVVGTGSTQPICRIDPGQDAHFLAPLPVRVLDDPPLVSLLERLGVTTLKDFATLPTDQIAQRCGPGALILQRCAAGEDPRGVAAQDIPPHTDLSWRSDQPITQLDVLVSQLHDTVSEFLQGLTDAHMVCTSVQITFRDDRAGEHTQLWSHPRFFTRDDIIHRVRWQWESLVTHSQEEHLEWGIVEVHFDPRHPDALFAHEPGLWGAGEEQARVDHHVAHIQSRLGHQAVRRPQLKAGHSYSQRESTQGWSDLPVELIGSARETPASWAGQLPRPHPATVFHPPQPVQVCDHSGGQLGVDRSGEVISSEPAFFVWGQRTHQIVAWAGPWPVVERWWDDTGAQFHSRLQLLDQEGVGWLVSCDLRRAQWQVEARYD